MFAANGLLGSTGSPKPPSEGMETPNPPAFMLNGLLGSGGQELPVSLSSAGFVSAGLSLAGVGGLARQECEL